ncbi:sugar nucleotide epimerase [Catenovulum agarivorans DS-2]|uniref:Sugar nucleotide epimerase n=1 Tax=Catenovulum agarivorans DS-2 TaxID=1328313 RepID=W7QJQ0_9ALTE|nr:TIGR01777 family oxidoreductase [Catenovulum agarivorans]EWH09197.1 sugar nucleotide epimerase [Catenovulum agarivorans DS-2]
MNMLITGGTGLIGRALIASLLSESHAAQNTDYNITVLTRAPTKAKQMFGASVRVISHLPQASEFKFTVVINLAGEPIADKRWSQSQKDKICQSRWKITQQLVNLIEQANEKPQVFISGSAIGFYGRQPQGVQVDESHQQINNEFTHQVCSKWEQIALSCQKFTRVCVIRTGIVLSAHGGALAKMLPAFKFGLGGPMGSGEQMMSWIHIDDHVDAIKFLIHNNQCQGPINLTSPNPVSNQVFSQTLASVLSRPCVFRTPKWLLVGIFGEMSDLLLTGQAVIPKHLTDQGFSFQYAELKQALSECT